MKHKKEIKASLSSSLNHSDKVCTKYHIYSLCKDTP